MVDFEGKPVKPGDEVIFAATGKNSILERGEVIRLTPKGVSVSRYPGDTSGLFRPSSRFVVSKRPPKE